MNDDGCPVAAYDYSGCDLRVRAHPDPDTEPEDFDCREHYDASAGYLKCDGSL